MDTSKVQWVTGTKNIDILSFGVFIRPFARGDRGFQYSGLRIFWGLPENRIFLVPVTHCIAYIHLYTFIVTLGILVAKYRRYLLVFTVVIHLPLIPTLSLSHTGPSFGLQLWHAMMCYALCRDGPVARPPSVKNVCSSGHARIARRARGSPRAKTF